jgi:hypothetical protein
MTQFRLGGFSSLRRRLGGRSKVDGVPRVEL